MKPPPFHAPATAARATAAPASELPLPDAAATGRLGRALAGLLAPGDALLLEGPLGAGKTTLARALIRAATGDPGGEVPSPSYTLVQEYDGAACRIAHLDLFRLSGPEALEELGWDEARDGIVLVEWPDRLGALAPAGARRVALSPAGEDGSRRLARLENCSEADLARVAEGMRA